MLASNKLVYHSNPHLTGSSDVSNCSDQGQAYEKKSKKGGRDAGEEHARYINLLSVVGPEMSQEK
jgi:hypothetical protein